MKRKMDKFKKFSLIALVTGGLVAGGVLLSQRQEKASKEPAENKEQNVVSLSTEQIQKFIKESDEVLKQLKATIESNDSGPEERFEARRAYRNISEERAQLQKLLDKAIQEQRNTIEFNAARGAR